MAKKTRPNPADASSGGGFDMTPMIDVTFLLIVFFMCVTEMADASKSPMNLPRVFNGEDDSEPDPSRLLINILENGKVQINSRDYSEKELNQTLKQQYIKSKSDTGVSDKTIILRVDKSTQYKDVQKIMQMCMDNQLWKISFSALSPEAPTKD